MEPNTQPSHTTSDSIGKLSETSISAPNNQEVSSLYLQLSKANPEAAILSLIPPYNEKFVKIVDPELPPLLNELFTEKYMDDTYEVLLERPKECFMQLSLTVKLAQRVEELTKTQTKSRSWFAYRAGRITASSFRAVVHTNISKPSLSLVRSIYYPYYYQFTSKYTEWGCQHEEEAITEYTRKMNTLHKGFNITKSGLILHPTFPHLGASPDGKINCECCGSGVLEVKCPYLCKTRTISEAIEDPKFCLETNEAASLKLKSSHAYYFQVQLQLLLCEAGYCDFVIWSQSELINLRITPDQEFLNKYIPPATAFFKAVLLPELLGK